MTASKGAHIDSVLLMMARCRLCVKDGWSSGLNLQVLLGRGLAGCSDSAAGRNGTDVLIIPLQGNAEVLSYTIGEDVENALNWRNVWCPLAINTALKAFVDLLAYNAVLCAKYARWKMETVAWGILCG